MNRFETRFINIRGELLSLETPQVMGILNVTPDSFYAESRLQCEKDIRARVCQLVGEGASCIDIGACSTRPGAEPVPVGEEMKRLRWGLSILRDEAPDMYVSVDTFRSDVATMAVEEYGADMVNDISAGEMDAGMFQTVARLGVPYIIMHMQGVPSSMQDNPHYENLLKEVFLYFAHKIEALHELGVKDIIIDPGFGFGKSVSDNYTLLHYLDEFRRFECPLLVGFSRKSMICKTIGCSPEEALNGTTVLNTIALTKGVHLLRVHDVKAAKECVRLWQIMNEAK